MAKASKPVEMLSSHLTKEEIQERKEAEEKLKGNDDLVYKVPRHLSKAEKKIYKFLVNELKESKILCNLDMEILEQTVTAIVKLHECKLLIDEYGIVITKENGDMVKNPALTAYKDFNAIFNKGMLELGLSPSARSRLAQLNINSKSEKEDPLLKILGSGSE